MSFCSFYSLGFSLTVLTPQAYQLDPKGSSCGSSLLDLLLTEMEDHRSMYTLLQSFSAQFSYIFERSLEEDADRPPELLYSSLITLYPRLMLHSFNLRGGRSHHAIRDSTLQRRFHNWSILNFLPLYNDYLESCLAFLRHPPSPFLPLSLSSSNV